STKVREQLADWQPRLAMVIELEWGANQVERPIGRIAKLAVENLFAMILLQPGFGIESIDVRKTARQKDHNQVLSLWPEVTRTRRQYSCAVQLSCPAKKGEESKATGATAR